MQPKFSETWCYEMLRRARWADGIRCPFCRSSRVTTHAKPTATPRRRYCCLSCRRTFTDFTGTPLSRTNLPLGTWILCLQRLGSPHTTADLARELGVKWDTAVQMERRLKRAGARPGVIRSLRETIGSADAGRSLAGSALAGGTAAARDAAPGGRAR